MSLKLTIPGFVIINAQQGSGKSHLIKYLFYKNQHNFDYGLVFCNTMFENSFTYLPKKYIHPEYNPNVLKKFMSIQANLVQKNIKKSSFIVFDDCLDSKQFHCPVFKRCITQLRHFNITVFIATQYVNCLPPLFRSNAFQIAIFQSDQKAQLKSLYESYGMRFGDFNEFRNYILTSTGDHKFIWYDKSNNAEEKEKRYPIYKCPAKIPAFSVDFNTKT